MSICADSFQALVDDLSFSSLLSVNIQKRSSVMVADSTASTVHRKEFLRKIESGKYIRILVGPTCSIGNDHSNVRQRSTQCDFFLRKTTMIETILLFSRLRNADV